MGKAAERGFNAAGDDRDILIGFASTLAIGLGGTVGAKPYLSAG